MGDNLILTPGLTTPGEVGLGHNSAQTGDLFLSSNDRTSVSFPLPDFPVMSGFFMSAFWVAPYAGSATRESLWTNHTSKGNSAPNLHQAYGAPTPGQLLNGRAAAYFDSTAIVIAPIAPLLPVQILGSMVKCEFTGESTAYNSGTGILTDLIGSGTLGRDLTGGATRPTLSSTPGGKACFFFNGTTDGLWDHYNSESQIDPLAALPALSIGQRGVYLIFKVTPNGTFDQDLFTTGNEGIQILGSTFGGQTGFLLIFSGVGVYHSFLSDARVDDNAWHTLFVWTDETSGVTQGRLDGVTQAGTMTGSWGSPGEWGGFGAYFGQSGANTSPNGYMGYLGFVYTPTSGTLDSTLLSNLDTALHGVITG